MMMPQHAQSPKDNAPRTARSRDVSFEAGGPVEALHHDIAARLGRGAATCAMPFTAPGGLEAGVMMASRIAGPVMLAAGYAAVGLLIFG